MAIIDSEFQSLIPPLSDEETQRLEKSLTTNGWQDWREPIITWNGTIIDGNNRYRICDEHSIEFKTMEMQFDSRDAAKIWIIENQFTRRNLNKYDRGVLALRLEEMYAKQAKKRMLAGKANPTQKSAEGGETRDKVAAIAGISHDTLRKVKVIETEAAKGNDTAVKAREAVKSGKKSIHKAYTEVRANGDKTDTRPLCTVCGKPVDNDDCYAHDRNKHKACAYELERQRGVKKSAKPRFTDDGRRICKFCGKPIENGDHFQDKLGWCKACGRKHETEMQRKYRDADHDLRNNTPTYTIESLTNELMSSAESMRDAMAQSIAINESMGVKLSNSQKKRLDRAVTGIFNAIQSIEKESNNG